MRVALIGSGGGVPRASVAFAASGAHPNEPAGFSELTTHPFDVAAPQGWTMFTSSWDPVTIETDATAPKSPSNIGRALFPAGFPAGSGPVNLVSSDFGTQTELYVHFWLKMDSNWDGNDSSQNKIFFLKQNTHGNVIFGAWGSGSNPLEFRVQTQGAQCLPGGYNEASNLSTATVTRGQWIDIEVLIRAETNTGDGDGEIHIWTDGVKRHEDTSVCINQSGDPPGLDQLIWNPTYGGGGDPVPYDMNMDIDHIYISSA